METIPDLFRAISRGAGGPGGYCRIRTPRLYPDGDNIDVFCRREGEKLCVTDLAETAGWLRMQSLSPRRSAKQNRLIEDACQTHGVEFARGMLHAHCGIDEKELAATVTRVSEAALRISDRWFTDRTRAAESVADGVAASSPHAPFRSTVRSE